MVELEEKEERERVNIRGVNAGVYEWK